MLNEDFARQLDRVLDGDLPEKDYAPVTRLLRNDPAALDWFVDRAWLHAEIREALQRKAIIDEVDLSSTLARERTLRVSKRGTLLALAAGLALLLLVAGVFREDPDRPFASLVQTRAALWKSGDLPTADGSRIGPGTLHLAEGLATLRFDSGAEVTLEAPAELTLIDEMRCELKRGTVVSDIPDSAHGFCVLTPNADVIDRGTRFAVSVHETTGVTHTQVLDGKVEVASRETGNVVELHTGQRNTVEGSHPGEASEEIVTEPRTIPIESEEHNADWIFLEAVKDAYTGHVPGHESDVLLYLKKGGPERTAYLGFNLDGIEAGEIEKAELLLWFAPTGWGLASLVPDSVFGVYGLQGDIPAWGEPIMRKHFPGTPEVVMLGSFPVSQGVQRGRFGIQTEALKRFLRERAGTGITLKVSRETSETEDGGLVHGFASRRHPTLPGPTLAIRLTSDSAQTDSLPD